MDHLQMIVTVIGIVLPMLAMLFLILRFWGRKIQHTPLGWDDYSMLLALLTTFGVCAMVITGTTYAHWGQNQVHEIQATRQGGTHTYSRTMEVKIWFALQLLQTFALSLIKLSVFFLYKRVFPPHQTSTSYELAYFFLSVYCLLWFAIVLMLHIVVCKPIDSQWEGPLNGTCRFALSSTHPMMAVTNSLDDLCLLILPLATPRRGLEILLKNKIMAAVSTLAIAIAVAGGFARGAAYWINGDPLAPTNPSYGAMIATAIEPCMSIVGVCLPICLPVFERVFGLGAPPTNPQGNGGVAEEIELVDLPANP